MEDPKSQDADLAKEFAKIKAMQARLAKKLKEQEKDKATSQNLSSCPETVPEQDKKSKRKDSQEAIVSLLMTNFLIIIALLLVLFGLSGLFCQIFGTKCQRENHFVANQAGVLDPLIMENTKMQGNLDYVNKTTVEKPYNYNSYNEKAWSILLTILIGILVAFVSLVCLNCVIAAAMTLHDLWIGTTSGDDQLYIQIQNFVNELEKSGDMSSMTKQRLKPLLQNSIDVKNQNGETNLYTASRYGRTEQARILLELGADANIKTDNQQTALHSATSYGHFEVAKLLLQHGAFVLSMNGNNATPLHYALSAEIVQLLLENSADLEAEDVEKFTPLCYAAGRGNIEVVEKLIQSGADIHARNHDQQTPLHIAAEAGKAEMVEFLIQNGAKINKVEYRDKTPLHLAARHGFPEVVEILLKHGAKKDLRDRWNDTPLRLALQFKKGDYKKVIALLK